MRIILAVIALLFISSDGNAQPKLDQQTVAFLQAFTRRVSQHDKKHTQCIHTMSLADKHLTVWRNWNKTRHWPQLAPRVYDATKQGKRNVTSVVRISWYLYEDSTREIEADNLGRAGSFCARYDLGPYETGAFLLKPTQMTHVQRLLRQLPPSKKVTNWKDVLFISGRRNGRWTIRMYSRKQKPKVVRDLLHLLTPQN